MGLGNSVSTKLEVVTDVPFWKAVGSNSAALIMDGYKTDGHRRNGFDAHCFVSRVVAHSSRLTIYPLLGPNTRGEEVPSRLWVPLVLATTKRIRRR
jgi:hypothetical protein